MKTKKTSLIVTILICSILIIIITVSTQAQSQTRQKCTVGWHITGYFTPIESDYNGSKSVVDVSPFNNTNNIIQRSFYTSFLHEVKVEGWGKTLQGDYIGLVTKDKQWHSASKPTSADNKYELKQRIVAVDMKLIKFGQNLTIPTLPSPWNSVVYTAADTGPDIKGKHIDVFTGEGEISKMETLLITSNNGKVCIIE